MNHRHLAYAKPLTDRQLELLADRATWGLTDAEARELELAGAAGDLSLDLAAASAELAFASLPIEPMPAGLRAKILSQASATFAATRDVQAPRRLAPLASWLVAAAAIVVAAVGWMRTPGVGFTPLAPAADRRGDLIRRASDVSTIAWADFQHPVTREAPEITGVSGDVVWSEREQRGFMRIRGLRPNDPSIERYQLWIIDARGLSQRVSGGLFNIAESGEAVIEFTPDLPIHDAAIFAVTIESPEGVAVSDMTRRACAAVKS